MSALKDERLIAGLRCGEVLAGLTEYLEGGLEPSLRRDVEAHVRGCELCERFGGAFGETIAAIRRSASQEPVPAEVLGRLNERLRRAM